MKQPDMEKLIAEELLGKALNDEERRQLEDFGEKPTHISSMWRFSTP